jgi:poly-gamma-glutamate capsule biosynthesis protein CapA/YwtB (metallophosphatase superfamily)
MAKRKLYFGAILLLAMIIVVTGCTIDNFVNTNDEDDPPETVNLPPPQKITLAAVGDVMAHMPQVNGAWDPERQIYDFGPSFSVISPYLKEADLTIANLETVLDDSRPYHGYPRFNSPSALALALKEAGVDVVTTANNHALDQGEQGLLNCLDHLDCIGLLHTGTFRTASERQPLIIPVKGFNLACLAYTTTTNGLPLPAGKDYLVNMWDKDVARADIQAAREQGAEFVITSIHAGPEYQRYPSDEQKQIVQDLIQGGADLILGCHPHVVQPWAEQIKPGCDQRALVAYSLGNFISNQYFPYTDRGMILEVTLAKDPLSGIIDIDYYRVIPTRVLREQRHTIVVDDKPEFF